MTRQCLYCGKELPKTTASNFCSKECWTEYKKLKAMNVDADKQATVLLKKVDMPLKAESSQNEIDTHEPTEEPMKETDLMDRMDAFESLIQERLNDLDDSFRSLAANMSSGTSSEQSEHGSLSDDVLARLAKLEEELERIQPGSPPDTKLEERISALEKRIRQLNTSEHREKKGFFARLFS
jgi:hypothetical protein